MDQTIYYRHVPSPIGTLLLTSSGEALTGLHMIGLEEAPRRGRGSGGFRMTPFSARFAGSSRLISMASLPAFTLHSI